MKTADFCSTETNPKTRLSSLERMDAIACGVHARFEESTGFSRKITDATINVARALGVPDSEIKKWAASRSLRLVEEGARIREIKTVLEKYYGNSLGITA